MWTINSFNTDLQMSASNNDLAVTTNQNTLRQCLEDTKAMEAVVAEDLDEEVQVNIATDTMVEEVHQVATEKTALVQMLLLKQCCLHHTVQASHKELHVML